MSNAPGHKYAVTKCHVCGRDVADNWYIQHRKSNCVRGRHPKHYRVARTHYTLCGLTVTDATRVTNIDNVTCRRCIKLIAKREVKHHE